MDESECIREFTKVFHEKTGNDWADCTPNCFRQVQGKYRVMELGINSDQQPAKPAPSESTAPERESTLEQAVKRLMDFIFNMDLMSQSLKSMEIDLTQMSLGKISLSQIQCGFGVLKDIQTIIQNGDLNDFDRGRVLPPASPFSSLSTP